MKSMSFFPKRISELATLDSDVETPDKYSENRNKNKGYRTIKLPKRITSLQDSDSEDDKLNCAIVNLNESFVLSPSSKDFDFTDQIQQNTNTRADENNKNELNRNAKTSFDDSGFLSRVNALKVGSPPQQLAPDATKSNTDSNSNAGQRAAIKSRTQLFPDSGISKSLNTNIKSVLAIAPMKSSNNNNNQVKEGEVEKYTKNETVKFNNEPKDIRPPLLSLLKDSKTIEEKHETPLKKNDQQLFVTPSIRPFSTTKMSSSIISTCERDQHKQPQQQPKILFRTPIARPFSSSTSSSMSTPVDVRQLSILQRLSPIQEPVREKPKENVLTINSIDYVIGKKIGIGGSSNVYLAKGQKSGKECAIKFVNLDGDPQVIEGYLNETKLLAKLQGNINVVALYDYCHLPEKRILYMVMEKGESDLHKILQEYKSHIPLYTLINFWYQILQAVNYIHQNGVIHSDLKPANFLMIQGRLKLIDFGIASNIAIDSTSIIKFSQAGTFNYISPEALIDTSNDDSPSTHHQPKIRLSTKSDVWSLGCILYLLLYKKTPFSHVKVLHQKISVLTNPKTTIDYPQLPNFYPPMLAEMLKNCLIYNPKERSSVADLLRFPFNMVIPDL